MEHSPSCEANRFSASQEIPAFYRTRRYITAFTCARQLSQLELVTCKYWCLLSGYRSSGMFRCGNLKFRNCNFSNLTRLDDRKESVFILEKLNIILVYTLFCLHLSTFITILIAQLTFPNTNYHMSFPKFFAYHRATVRVSLLARVPTFEKQWCKVQGGQSASGIPVLVFTVWRLRKPPFNQKNFSLHHSNGA